MGDVFCLVILQNGNRRKLKLATGTYAEFLEKLTAVVDVDLEETLIQMFDTDLDDFVDLVPEDEILNKAKLRVVSRSASVLCNAAVCANGQNVAATSPQNPCAIQPASIHEQGEVSLEPCATGIQEAGSDAKETSQAVRILTRVEDAPCAILSYKQVSGSDVIQVDDAAISHSSMHNSDDYLKFVLPPSFGVWCDTFLQSKRPVTAKAKMHIISVLFKACYSITAHPTPRLYDKVLDSLVAKYPHVMEGKYNRRRWLIALRSWFKSERENLTVASDAAVEVLETCGLNLSQADDNNEHTYTHAQHALANQKTPSSSSANSSGCEDKSVEEEHLSELTNTSAHTAEADTAGDSEAMPLDTMVCLVSDPAECLEMSEHSEDVKESMDCSDHSNAMLEDVTVSSLLGMCTDEKTSEALMAQQESWASPDESESCDEPTEEVRHSKNEQIREAVGSVFQKKPHVSNGKGKTGKIIWNDGTELEEEMSEGNVNELPLNDRVVIGTRGVPAASPTTVCSGTLQRRSSSTDSSESGKRYESFSFHFEDFPEYIRKALKAQRPLPSIERRALVRCVVEQLTEVCPRPRWDLIREAARTVVQAFPDALEDRGLDGELLGKGYNSFFQQLISRAYNVALGGPNVLPGTSQGRSSSTYSSESERQNGSFLFHLEYLPELLQKALKAKRPLPAKERREVVRCVVEQMTTMCSRPRRDLIREAAVVVVQAFPDALEDRSLDGRLIGKGYDSFFQQLESRVENNASKRVKSTVTPGALWCGRKPVKASYGCVNWQPVRNSEPSEDIDDKIQFLKREGKKSLEEIDVPLCDDYMEETYPEQRSFINANPAPCISKVKEEWPMLFHKPFFYKHGNKLLAKDVKAIFDQNVSTCAPPLLQQLESVPRKEVMYTLTIMQEAIKKGNTKAVEEAVLPLLCSYFKEEERHLFRVLEEETNISEILHELPCTPTIIALGSIFQKKCFVTCKQQILFTEPVDFSEATCLLLLSYYVFNLVYADPVATTLEFLQREMFAINPPSGSKCRDGRKSRKTVRSKIMELIHQLR